MRSLTDFDLEELAELFARWGCKPSHARRLLHHFYARGDVDWAQVQLGSALRNRLLDEIPLRQSTITHRSDSSDGATKLLIALTNGGAVESVLMPAYRADRAAGCISSQIGCAMRCDFCASTAGGLERDLSAGEIVEQFLHLRRLAADAGRRLATLVFMGMGEPMLNLDNVLAAIRRIIRPDMGDLGGRAITVSTVGVVPRIDTLAAADLNVHLAISLHAPDDATRTRIVPANRKWPVAEVIAAAKRFHERTGRIVTIEYCLLSGVNDSDAHARALADLLTGLRFHVNLIPYNPIGAGVSGIAYAAPTPQRAKAFNDILFNRKIVAHLRRPRGQDIAAACGQLRRALRSPLPDAPPVPSPGTPGEG